jgi:hypothetical protein
MTLTVMRYRGTSSALQAEVRVSTPYDAVSLLLEWRQRFPRETGVLLDEHRRTIATSQPSTGRTE